MICSDLSSPLLCSWPPLRMIYRDYIERAMVQVPKHRILVLSSEDMTYQVEALWKKIAEMTGVSAAHKRLDEFKVARYNTQASKGFEGRSMMANFFMGRYEISQYRPMFNSTRRYLEKCWRKDCHWIMGTFSNDAFLHNYSACEGLGESKAGGRVSLSGGTTSSPS